MKKTGDTPDVSHGSKTLQRELDCARMFASTLDLKQLTANFLKIVHGETPFARGTIFYVDHEQKILRSLIAQDAQGVEITVPIGAGMLALRMALHLIADCVALATGERFEFLEEAEGHGPEGAS